MGGLLGLVGTLLICGAVLVGWNRITGTAREMNA
jgi:hypothetical protein